MSGLRLWCVWILCALLAGACSNPGGNNGNTGDDDDDDVNTPVLERAYVADYLNGFLAVDVTDPTAPVVVGISETPLTAHAVTIFDDYAFVSDQNDGLRTFGIAGGLNPPLLDDQQGLGRVLDTAVTGTLLVVAGQMAGVTVLDITDPSAAQQRGNVATDGLALGIDADGSYAYVGDQNAGLQVVDLSDPDNPAIVGNYDSPDVAYDVEVHDGIAYLADEQTGLITVDVSNPAQPAELARASTPGLAYRVTVQGDYAYVADQVGGLAIFNVSDPANPAIVGALDPPEPGANDPPGESYGVRAYENLVFLTDFYGLHIIDVSSPSAPEIIGQLQTPGDAWDVALDLPPAM